MASWHTSTFVVEKLQQFLAPVKEKICHGGGSFQGCFGHEVEHGGVAGVPYADGYRQGKLRYGGGKIVILEGVEIAGGASSADNCYGIPPVGLVADFAEGGDNAGGRTVALHGGGEEFHREAQPGIVVDKLMNKIAESGGRWRGNDCDALHRDGPR